MPETTPIPDRLWAVTVTIPAHIDEDSRLHLFDVIADAAHDWEPKDRDGWDIDVSGGPVDTPATPDDNCSHCGGSGWKGDDPDNPDPCHCTVAPDPSGTWTCPDCAFSFAAEHTDAGGGYSCPVCAETRLAAEVAAERAENRTLRLTMRTVRDIAADRAEKVAEIARLLDEAEVRALTEDTPDLPSVIADEVTP